MDVKNTNDAENLFDAICYRKGASFIKQMAILVGDEVIDLGMRYFFDKFAMRNAVLSDYLDCLDAAAK